MTAKKSPAPSSSHKAQTKALQSDKNSEKLHNLKTEALTQNISQLEVELASSNTEKDDWKAKSIRYAADLQNSVRQNGLDLSQAKKNTKKSTVLSLVPFLNTLNIAFAYTPQTEDPKVKTFISTLNSSFQKAISDFQGIGVEILTAQAGDAFNPEFMSILNGDVETDSHEVKVKQVVSIGLKIDNQLIQPISVIVG
jgi:molecular chaperone GrpE (heat shock protein)